MNKIYFLIFLSSLNLQIADANQHNEWIDASKIFFKKIAEPQLSYPDILENSAINGSNKDIRLIAKIWLSIQEEILIGNLEISDRKIEDYSKKSEEYAINWLKLGAMRGDGLCSYQLSLIYRFRKEKNIEISEDYAKKCVEILESKLPSISSEEYLALLNCYGMGWGVSKNYEISKKLYSSYIQQCYKKNIKPLNWDKFNFNYSK